MTITPYDINPRALAEMIEAVRQKRRIEVEARGRVDSAHERLKLAIDSRATAESRLFDYVSKLADKPDTVRADAARASIEGEA